MKNNIFLILVSIFFWSVSGSSYEIKIIAKVNNQIITNIDIENEKKYLYLLNEDLGKLDKNEFFNLAKDSLIKEKIKKRELENYIDLNKKFDFENSLLLNLASRLGFENLTQLKLFLDNKRLNYDEIKKKILLEALWNQIIFEKFQKNIKINKILIEENTRNYFLNLDIKYEYKLSEILITDNQITIDQLKLKINELGFKIAANKFSNSDSSIFGGDLGWVKETNLSEIVKKKIINLDIGEVTEPINLNGGFLIIKLEDKRELRDKIDIEKEIKNQIAYETKRQLNLYSINYYKKIKQNTTIYEN